MIDPATESVFGRAGEGLLPSAHARGPWDPRALHGGAPAGLLAAAFERLEPGAELRVARLGYEFLRPVPLAPLSLSLELARPGRRVQELAAELRAEQDGELQTVCRASALRVQEIPAGTPAAPPGGILAMPPLERCEPIRFALDDGDVPADSLATSGMEMRAQGDPRRPGPARVWMRLRRPLLSGEQPSPLAHLAATADFGNGISAVLPFERFLFINADLTIHLWRMPHGEWIGLDSQTVIEPGGTGLTESVLHDLEGPVGRAFQTLVVQPR